MAAAEGNKYWEARKSHGRNKIFKTPQDLWEAAIEYFIWISENPLLAAELVKFKGKATLEDLPKMRAMTETDFCEHALISLKTWTNYCSGDDSYKDFVPITTRIKHIISNQKFQGAAAELLNPNIIARDLGLKDRRDVTSDDEPLSITLTPIADEE